MNRSTHISLLCGWSMAIVTVLSTGAAAENWPQWRGPDGDGVAADGEYPVEFDSDKSVAWKVTLPGDGCSTPAVWGDAIIVTCDIDGDDGVICYTMAGEEKWRQKLGPGRPGKNRNASGSNPSPTTDGQHVVAYFKSGTLACLDMDGHERWRTNLQEKYGPDTLWWDLSTSPVLTSGRVIVAVMQEGDSYLAAFELATGKEIWKQPRNYVCARETDHAYTTPEIVSIDGLPQLVVWGADHLTGHDLATGQVLWDCGGFNPDNRGSWRVIASPAIEDGIAFVPYGRGDYVAAVRLGGDGDITSAARLWEKSGRRLTSEVPTPVVRDGLAYLLGDGGRVACMDIKSGDEIWSGDLPRSRKRYYSSPALADDKIYCAREDGIVYVVGIAGGFELLAENDMGESIIATPVPIDNGLLIRGREHLFRIE